MQIGDPFRGKALIEVSLDLVERDLVLGLQDCGAAGLASSLAEMARGDAGVDVHLDRVPLREPDLEAWEIMISESQERMVAVVAPERLAEVEAACERWELPCTVIGEVTGHGELRAYFHGEVVGSIPADLLTDRTARATRSSRRPASPSDGAAANAVHPASHEPKTWVFEQYDQLVGSRTVRRPGLDAAVLRIDGVRGIAVSLDGPPLGERDPFRAGWAAVMDAALNVACAGGEPLALTDCLNFGNPERTEIAWELGQAIEGISQAAEELGIPVVSGNVSLYNETGGRPIPPTPVVGCVGLVRDVTRIPTRWREGDRLLLLRGEGAGLVRFVWENAHRFSLAHDVSDGGLELALREAADWSGTAACRRSSAADGPGVIVALAPGARPGDHAGLDWDDVAELGSRLVMCGVFGIHAPGRDVARLTYFGLHALQHRGQESAGIAVSDHGRLTALRDLGPGHAGVRREEPLGPARRARDRPHALLDDRLERLGERAAAAPPRQRAHRRARPQRQPDQRGRAARRARGALASTSDSEMVAALIANDERPLPEAIAATMEKLEGAASIVGLADGRLFAFRDRHGFRPLVLGRLGDDPVVASETCALDLIGAAFEREIRPGELFLAGEDGEQVEQVLPPTERGALCIFEFFYLARPDSRLAGVEVHGARVRMGERLAEESPVEADLVLPIPDSGTPAAIGFSRATGIPFSEGLIKNRYVHRTFIQPDQSLRDQGVRMKFNPLAEVAGKRLVVVDDSIVRGSTTRQIVQMLFDSGAAEVHVRVSSPPVVSPCFYGIDLATRGRDDRRARDRRGRARGDRRDLARLPLARGPPGRDAPAGVGALPRLPDARLPDAAADRHREAALRARAGRSAHVTRSVFVSTTWRAPWPAVPRIVRRRPPFPRRMVAVSIARMSVVAGRSMQNATRATVSSEVDERMLLARRTA